MCGTPRVRTGALYVLYRLTGEDFGFDKEAWTRFLEREMGDRSS